MESAAITTRRGQFVVLSYFAYRNHRIAKSKGPYHASSIPRPPSRKGDGSESCLAGFIGAGGWPGHRNREHEPNAIQPHLQVSCRCQFSLFKLVDTCVTPAVAYGGQAMTARPGTCRGEAFACWHSNFAGPSAFVKTMADKTADRSAWPCCLEPAG